MSLFGTSPEDTASRSKSTLFEDSSTSRKVQGSGLFADDSGTADDSPWGFQPTPKKQARGNLVKTLLPADDVPESYIDTFDGLAEGNTISFVNIRRILENSRLSTQEQQRIVDIVSPQGSGVGDSLGRGEFNVLLALIGLSQEGDEASLDSVDDRRRRLPIPSLPDIARPRPETPQPSKPTSSHTPVAAPQTPSSTQPRPRRGPSYSISDADPWATSPANKHTNGSTNGMASNMPGRTTSTFTTTADDATDVSSAPAYQTSSGSVAGDWAGHGSASTIAYGSDSVEERGFGADSRSGPGDEPTERPRKQYSSRQTSHGAEEEVAITCLQEKQGTLLFQYRNYEVATARRNSKVVRRYSDFVWLLDCLHKRYPFRQLPLLPPKRVAINGNHIAADTLFIEKRRRGLQRFANALVRHPILSQEQLVVMFLTVPTELSGWRKAASINTQEEFTGKPLPPTLEDSLPSTLPDLFDTVRSGVRSGAETYINLCNSLERIIKRQEGLSGEYSRFQTLLSSSTESTTDTYNFDTNDVPLLNEGIASTAKHIGTSSSLILDEARSWEDGALEDFKRQRDGLVSMREMFERRDRYARDTIPACEKRIAANEGRLAAVRAKPEGVRKVGEAEKLEDAIMKDKESIVAQHARGVFIKECIRDEIQIFQASQYHVTRLHQDWSSDRVRFADMQLDCWRRLTEDLESIPGGG